MDRLKHAVRQTRRIQFAASSRTDTPDDICFQFKVNNWLQLYCIIWNECITVGFELANGLNGISHVTEVVLETKVGLTKYLCIHRNTLSHGFMCYQPLNLFDYVCTGVGDRDVVNPRFEAV